MALLRRASLIFGAGLAGACACAYLACLPDLDTLPEGVDSGTPITTPIGPHCGDGVINQTADGSYEQCDPGEAGAPGCSANCTIACPNGAYFDAITSHCYFTAPTTFTLQGARDECAEAGAHVVTFVSDGEFEAGVDLGSDAGGGFWIGLEGSLSATNAYFAENQEPGWAVPPSTNCSGCYAKTLFGGSDFYRLPDSGILPEYCVVGSSKISSYIQLNCGVDGSVGVVCEREPPGVRAAPCEEGICVTVSETLGKKRYIYNQQHVTADIAEQSCQFNSGRLVVFKTREEREELVREIALFSLSAQTTTNSFWIGLSRVDDASSSWTWDDGSAEVTYPSVWGNNAPEATGPSRAYVEMSIGEGTPYDNQLAHADDPTALRPFVCEYALQ